MDALHAAVGVGELHVDNPGGLRPTLRVLLARKDQRKAQGLRLYETFVEG